MSAAEGPAGPDAAAPAAAPAPLVRVVGGNPSAEELAVVVAVLTAAAAAMGEVPDPGAGGATVVSRWTSRERAVRTTPRPTSGGWRASAFPPAM